MHGNQSDKMEKLKGKEIAIALLYRNVAVQSKIMPTSFEGKRSQVYTDAYKAAMSKIDEIEKQHVDFCWKSR
ncbi:hypothetical protein NIES2135_66060 (plasmid) [Leptolyngbya boryana NIES-2135]|jgi:hypothetical protein|uniref:Uncharacterized protein n=1 Tax=Leptolyngbya boryana NIES-2135 TaxID=1973484 RepID=A0A1Z4JSL5_LEPBY|nr:MULTISPECIES: hypothetical protein [Leptolyngbya]BAY59729.1 hypothetical protein NIES2135_66060 [Leptolyngbya boryana NIES-2135]MBD2370617.1 hypothetical protein [Leptolyngbya sp. FACHB-161]MBD2377000.1 hypothetical protein [Leptolyngbya sp. FACHB-238]MBD2401367.1 hypothetical protein [Leptolyngbya sp. FACHB-239]MBD2407918.1 hypothetical protein [Leptolyngbya sp. FACHB-402]